MSDGTSNISKSFPFSLSQFMNRSTEQINSIHGEQSKYMEQIATGDKYNSFVEMDQREAYLSLTNKVMKIDQFELNAAQAKIFLNDQKTAFNSLVEELKTLRATTTTYNNNTVKSFALQNEANRIWEILEKTANQKNLFTGENKGNAVDFALLDPVAFPSVADTKYYTGGTADRSIKVSTLREVKYKPLVNTVGFEKAVRATNILRGLVPTDLNYMAKVQEAQKLLRESIGAEEGTSTTGDNMINHIAHIDGELDTIQAAEVENVAEKMTLNEHIASIQSANTAEAILKEGKLRNDHKMQLALTMQNLSKPKIADMIISGRI